MSFQDQFSSSRNSPLRKLRNLGHQVEIDLNINLMKCNRCGRCFEIQWDGTVLVNTDDHFSYYIMDKKEKTVLSTRYVGLTCADLVVKEVIE